MEVRFVIQRVPEGSVLKAKCAKKSITHQVPEMKDGKPKPLTPTGGVRTPVDPNYC